ncbi:copper resistance protein CopC [Amycolatopsis sp. NPDC059027]|uniref:copper resistance CopC family protein n=1 Tax=Amycolatopsis sp. NPDC059027 TaxID=3346709 RepID=UPI00367323AB
MILDEQRWLEDAGHRFAARVAVLLTVVVLALLLWTPGAHAHSVLVSSTPAKGASIATSPEQVVLEFNEPLEKGFTELTVIGPDGGTHWEGGPMSIVDAKVSAPVHPLGSSGAYTIHYRVISADGHPVSGTVPFTLTVPGPANAAPVTSAAAAPVAAPSVSSVDSGVPLWPWITGGVVLLLAGFAVARRMARAPARAGR